MRQSNICARTITVADPNVAVTAPGFTMLNVSKAWQYSTGNGVPVAVIDTGVNPSPRLPVVPGGDYIMGGDGLMDCDSHGTIVASLIARRAARHSHARADAGHTGVPATGGPPPAVAAPPPPGGPPPPIAPPPPPSPVTITETNPPATAAATATAGRAVERARRPGSRRRAGRPRGAAASAGSTRRGRRGGTARENHLHPAVVAGLRTGQAGRRRHRGPQEGRHHRHAGQRDRACGQHGGQGDQHQRHRMRVRGRPVGPERHRRRRLVRRNREGRGGRRRSRQRGRRRLRPESRLRPAGPSDPRDWHQVKTVSSPSWFSDYVLSVGAVDNTGAPLNKSLSGPWVAAAAPGVGIMGLSPQTGGPVNAYPPIRPGEKNMPFWGTSFSAAYVSGVAALVRAKYPGSDRASDHQPDPADGAQPTPRGGQPGRLRSR